MKFGIFALSTVPGTYEERERLRPIAHNSERVQRMYDELRAIAVRADQSGFDAFATTEHHFHSEGLELSPAPLLFFADLAARTSRIKFVTQVLAVPSWDPIRLAEEIAVLDHLTKGRFIAGIGRGYQHRWVNVLGQQYGVAGAVSDGSEEDLRNREIFEELFAIMKMAWTEDTVAFKGKYYEVPVPMMPESGNCRSRAPGASASLPPTGSPQSAMRLGGSNCHLPPRAQSAPEGLGMKGPA